MSLALTRMLFLVSMITIAADDPHAEDRKALLKILHEMEAGINSQDIDHMVSQMDAAATVTWLNGEISRGHAEIKAYYHRMVKGDQRIITKYTSAAKLGAGARFYGNGLVAVADGTTEDEFFPIVRGPFRLHSNWSATAAKLDGQWKIVNLHLSANVFSNTLMDEAKAALLYVGCGGLVAGGLVGWFLSRRRRPVT